MQKFSFIKDTVLFCVYFEKDTTKNSGSLIVDTGLPHKKSVLFLNASPLGPICIDELL